MKKNVAWLLLGITLVVFSACAEKKNNKEIIAHKPQQAAEKPVQKIGDYEQSRPVSWLGAQYTIEMKRVADSSLTVIDDGNGAKYYDNKMVLHILRADGSSFFEHTFTKADFQNYVDAGYLRRFALLGVVFDKVEGNSLRFAASVGSPDKMSDEYVPLVLKISKTGMMSIYKDTQMDTGDEDTHRKASADDDEDGV